MKMIIVTGKGGKIVGTAREVEGDNPEAGFGGPIAGPDQSIQVIDVPKELEKIVGTAREVEGDKPEAGSGGPIAAPDQPELGAIGDASELHRKLMDHLKSSYKK